MRCTVLRGLGQRDEMGNYDKPKARRTVRLHVSRRATGCARDECGERSDDRALALGVYRKGDRRSQRRVYAARVAALCDAVRALSPTAVASMHGSARMRRTDHRVTCGFTCLTIRGVSKIHHRSGPIWRRRARTYAAFAEPNDMSEAGLPSQPPPVRAPPWVHSLGYVSVVVLHDTGMHAENGVLENAQRLCWRSCIAFIVPRCAEPNGQAHLLFCAVLCSLRAQEVDVEYFDVHDAINWSDRGAPQHLLGAAFFSLIAYR